MCSGMSAAAGPRNPIGPRLRNASITSSTRFSVSVDGSCAKSNSVGMRSVVVEIDPVCVGGRPFHTFICPTVAASARVKIA